MKSKHQIETMEPNERETPPHLLAGIIKEWKLDTKKWVDFAASKSNRKFKKYISKQENFLKIKHASDGFCNPPFDQLDEFVSHCHYLSSEFGSTILMLIPCYTDSSWWTRNIGTEFEKVNRFKFLEKRLGFWYKGRPFEEFCRENGMKPNKYWMPCVWILWQK